MTKIKDIIVEVGKVAGALAAVFGFVFLLAPT